MWKPILIVFAVVAIAYAGICGFLFAKQRSLLYFPTPAGPGAPLPFIALETDAGQVRVTVVPAAGGDAVLYFGGNAEEVDHALPTLQAAFPGKALYLMHYRGYSGSAGAPSESALFADSLALFDRVKREHESIIVIGRSLGSGVAVQLASRRPVARLVLVTPYNSIAGIAAGQYPYIPARLLLRDKFDSWRYAPAVNAPTLLIVAAQDEVIPRSSSEGLLAHFRAGIAAEVVLPEASHNTVSESKAYVALLAGAIDPGPPQP